MFTVGETTYTLKFNMKKVETIETVTKVSILGELSKASGFMPLSVLKALFSFALVEEATNEPVKQSKAQEMFEEILNENGLVSVNVAIMEKLQQDMGFMFR